MTMPNFLIIGAPKSGTTALYHYLKQHPKIYMSPVKEPGFFAFEGLNIESGPPPAKSDGSTARPLDSSNRYRELINNAITEIGQYQALFDGVGDEIAIGEASPAYIYHPKAPQGIHHYIPDARLIAILRHPVERAYSSFIHRVQQGGEPILDFRQVLEKEDYSKRNDVWWGERHYIRVGFYYEQMRRYFDIFDRNQIKVYLYEDLVRDSTGLLEDILGFVGVNGDWLPDVSKKHLVSGIPKNQLLNSLLTQPNPIKSGLKAILPEQFRKQIVSKIQKHNIAKPPLSPEVRQELNNLYREDILKLQELINRDLSEWIN